MSFEFGEWGPLVIKKLSLTIEFVSMLDVLVTSSTDCFFLLSYSSFFLAARACCLVGEVKRVGCG